MSPPDSSSWPRGHAFPGGPAEVGPVHVRTQRLAGHRAASFLLDRDREPLPALAKPTNDVAQVADAGAAPLGEAGLFFSGERREVQLQIHAIISPYGDSPVNTIWGIHHLVSAPYAHHVDVVTSRRVNLTDILARDFAGNQSALAKQIGRRPTYVNELIRGKRSFGEKIARAIERQLHLPPSALDFPTTQQGVREPAATYRREQWPFIFEAGRYWNLSHEQRTHIEKLVLLLVKDYEAGGTVPGGTTKRRR